MPFTRSQILNRYRTVLQVLSRHGMGFVAGFFGLGSGGPGAGANAARSAGDARGQRLRRALEELGPAFVKLGQLLSTRGDLLPPDIVAGLERLQDQVTPVPFAAIRTVLEAELGGPLEQRFAHLDAKPLAAASLGQVHGALLPDGTPVAVKVQRPGVAEQVELDLRVLEGLAAAAARRTRWARRYDLPGVAREFAQLLRTELDFAQEGRNAERFRTNFAADSAVAFPRVHWDLSTAKVLTLERVGGMRVTDRAALIAAGLDPAKIASRLAGAIFQMVLRDGFFHADPHPGNLFVSAQGAILFVDTGMVGELTPSMRANVVEYVLGVVTGDSDRVVQAIEHMGMVRRAHSSAALRADVERLQARYGDVPLGQVEFGPALRETMAIARRHEIAFPTGYAVLLKTLTTLEAVARQIDPHATLIGLAAPYAEWILRGHLSPAKLGRQVGRELLETGRYLLRIPRQVSRVLGLMESGEWRLSVDHSGLEPALHRLSAIANRLSIAILLASLIIGTALVSGRGQGSFLHRYAVADIGFLLIGAVGLWLVIAILGSGRGRGAG